MLLKRKPHIEFEFYHMPDCEKANSYQRPLTIEFLAAKFYRMSNKKQVLPD